MFYQIFNIFYSIIVQDKLNSQFNLKHLHLLG